VLGGMKGITYTQIAQYVVLILAYTIPAIFISLNLTGNPLPQLGLGGSAMRPAAAADPARQARSGGHRSRLQGVHHQVMGSSLNMFVYTLSLMIGTAGLPHVIIRFFTVPKVKDARYSAGWALVFIAMLYTTAPAVGAMARLNLMDTIQTGPVGAEDGNLLYADRPEWFKKWETTGLLQFEDKNDDGRIQYYDDKNPEFAAKAESFGWKGNEMVKVDRDIMVLANPEIAGLPNWVIALVVAGGLAAALSTAAGLLLAISSAISHDLLKGVFMKGISEKAELNAGRLSMIGAIARGRLSRAQSTGLRGRYGGHRLRSRGVVDLPGADDGHLHEADEQRRGHRGHARRYHGDPAVRVPAQGHLLHPGHRVPRQHGAGSGLVLRHLAERLRCRRRLVNFAVAFVVSAVTAPPPEHIQHLVEDVRVPRGAGEATGH
jgi:cation/acetate symporter